MDIIYCENGEYLVQGNKVEPKYAAMKNVDMWGDSIPDDLAIEELTRVIKREYQNALILKVETKEYEAGFFRGTHIVFLPLK